MMLSSCTVVGSNGGVSFSFYESLTVVGEARLHDVVQAHRCLW